MHSKTIKKLTRKVTSVVLAACMILTITPASAVLAEDSTEQTTEVTTQYEEASTESTEATTEMVTEEITTETTEAATEETTEATTENTEEMTEEASEEENTDSLIVFDHNYSDADTSVIQTAGLFVETADPSVFTKNTTVESNYDNAYIISFSSVEEARYAFSYYIDKVDYITDLSNVVTLADEESATATDPEEDKADMTNINNGNDPISNLNDIDVNNYNGYIALIDSGVSEADARLSVLGDDGSDSNGHGTRMYNYIKEENPDAKVVSIKAFSGNKTNIADVYAAIKLAIESKVSVINMSFVALDNEYNEILRNVIQEALDSGITVIGAAGNYSGDAGIYLPGSVGETISVGAANEDGTLYKTSNYNADLYVIATSTSEAAARYSGIFATGEDSEKVFKELTKNSDDINETEEPENEEAVLQSGYSQYYADQWWGSSDKTSFPRTCNISTTITGNATGSTSIASLGVSMAEPDNWSTLVPGYNWAYTWYVGMDTLKTNFEGAVNAWALFRGDASNPEHGAINFSDMSYASNSYAWWSCIDKGNAYPTIYNGIDTANLGFVKLYDEIRNIDGTDYEYAYYGAIWDTTDGTQSIGLIVGFWKEAPKPWRRYIKVKKVNGNNAAVTGCELYVYDESGSNKISTGHNPNGLMTDNGDGTYTWISDYITTDAYLKVSIYESKGGGIYNNSSNNGKWIQSNGTLGSSASSLSTSWEYKGEEAAVYPVAYTATQVYNARLRIKKEPEHPGLYNTSDYSLDGAVFKIYKTRDNAVNDSGDIATLTTKKVGNIDGYTDWFDVSSYMNTTAGIPSSTTFYAKEITASKGYYINSTIWNIVVNPNSASEVTYTVKEPEEAWLYLKKTSSDASCTNGNPNYDLSGATYKVFDKKEDAQAALTSRNYSKAFMTFVCDKNGNTTKQKIGRDHMDNSTSGGVGTTMFYVVESQPGAKGYTRSNNVTEVTVTPTNDIDNPALINVKDTPVNDPIKLTVSKEDALYGSVEALEGVEFRFSFYAQDISTIRSAAYLKAHYNADTTETYKTNKNGVIDLTSKSYPRGYIVVEEISNPDTYSMDDIHVYLNGDKNKEITENLVLITDAELTNNDTGYKGITWYPNNATTYAELASKGTKIDGSTFSFLATNTPIRGDIYLTKMDETSDKPMANVKFQVTNKETKEVHYFYTDENGFFSSKTDSYNDKVNYYDSVEDYDGTDNAQIWFGKFEDKEADATNGYGALSCGTYEIREMRCAANEGYQLEPAHNITIDADHTYVNILDPDAGESENKLWNTVKPDIHTTAIVKETDSKTLAQQGSNIDWTNQTIIDTVTFNKLRAGTTYTLLAELMIVDREGNVTPYLEGDTDTPYKRVKTFTTTENYKKSIYEISDTMDMELDGVDPTGLEEQQKKLVVYESLFLGDYATAEDIPEGDDIVTRYDNYTAEDDMDFFPVEHKDKDDTFQTVTPGDIHTTIKDNVSEDRIAHISPESTLTDSVYYAGLTVGEEYTITGTLQAKEGTDWSKIKYDPTDPNADEDGYVYSTEANEDTDGGNEENLPDTEDEDFNKNPNKAYTLRDAEGNPITASTTFVAESSEGYVDIEFVIDSTLLEGKSVVAFEELKYKDIIIAVHNDLHDEDETVHYPEFGTTTKNGKIDIVFEGEEQASKEVSATSGESFVDTIHYHNLLANRTYKAKGVLMDKETGEALKDATGKVITAETTFTTDEVAEVEMTESPDAFNFTTEDGTVLDLASDHANYLCDGDVDVVFEGYDFTNLANKVGVVFEEIYMVKDDKEIIIGEHKDIKDVDQFTYFIEVHTNATDKNTKIPVVPQDKQTTILDTVSYKNVIVGKKYKLTATLKVSGDKSGKYKDGDTLLDKNNKPVTVDFEFTPKTKDGEVVVEIPFDTTNLRNMNIVVFEDLYNIYGIKVAAHNDLTDKDQTVRVPGGGTTAKDKATGDNVAQADKSITLVDTITYKNLEPGKEYTATGTIYSKETKKPIQVNGVDFTKTVKFTPTEPDGTVDVVFEFSTRNLKGATLVVFEDVKYNNESVFIHADLEDEGQTVHIPEIGTTATVDNGKKSVQAAKSITIVDRVEYKNLVVGKEYTVSGVLWNKATSDKLVINGKNVTASTTFKAEKADGYVDLTFTFDATGFSGDIVVGETLKHNDIEVATHTDLTDEGQTVTITPPSTTPPKTGMTVFFIILGIMVVGGAGMLIFKKRKITK